LRYKQDSIEEYAMYTRLIAALALFVLAPQGAAKTDCDALACADVKQAIREVEARMRAGYSRAQGERYEARLRKLKVKRSKFCR
jgi:Skp family chaperone for outer membrane proteins